MDIRNKFQWCLPAVAAARSFLVRVPLEKAPPALVLTVASRNPDRMAKCSSDFCGQ